MKQSQFKVSMIDLLPLMQDSFDRGNSVSIVVTGNSMRPLFRHECDTAVLSPCDPQTLKRGDVPLYRRADGQFVLHRIIAVQDTTYTLVGDAQCDIEYGLEKERVLAVLTGFVRKGKSHSCQDFGYRLYVWLWMRVIPLRPHLLFLWECGERGKRLLRRMFHIPPKAEKR